MYYSSYMDKDALKYFKRKERLDKDFVWSKDIVQKLRKLNIALFDMQNALEQNVKSSYKLFSDLEKSGMSFLHGFKIIGTFTFEKEIVSQLYELGDCSKSQKVIIDKWENIAWYSREEIESWQLVFDSLTEDFMPLSKARLLNNCNYCFKLSLPEDDIEFCSYLYHFIKYNKTFSRKDISECTIKDFSPEIKLVLNYNVSELNMFSGNFSSRYISGSDFVTSMLEERGHTLSRSFEWSEKNIQKIMDVNSWLWKMTDELKQEGRSSVELLLFLFQKN